MGQVQIIAEGSLPIFLTFSLKEVRRVGGVD
jgi:hypothetical protein